MNEDENIESDDVDTNAANDRYEYADYFLSDDFKTWLKIAKHE